MQGLTLSTFVNPWPQFPPVKKKIKVLKGIGDWPLEMLEVRSPVPPIVELSLKKTQNPTLPIDFVLLERVSLAGLLHSLDDRLVDAEGDGNAEQSK